MKNLEPIIIKGVFTKIDKKTILLYNVLHMVKNTDKI